MDQLKKVKEELESLKKQKKAWKILKYGGNVNKMSKEAKKEEILRVTKEEEKKLRKLYSLLGKSDGLSLNPKLRDLIIFIQVNG